MKANQFIRKNDDAVSPVIAVILMVAITVVLAATVYVWVSGFGSNSNTTVAHTMSIASAGPITTTTPTGEYHYVKTFTVSSADPSLKYGDIKLTVSGNQYALQTVCAPTADKQFSVCAGSSVRAATDAVQAGDKFTILCTTNQAVPDDPFTAGVDETKAAGVDGSGLNCLDNKALLLLDTASNSVMVSLTIR